MGFEKDSSKRGISAFENLQSLHQTKRINEYRMQIKSSSRSKYKFFIKTKGLFSSGWKKNNDSQKKNRSLLSIIFRLFKEVKKNRAQLIFIIGMGFIANLLMAIFPWAGKYMIDDILPKKNMTILMVSCFILVLVSIIDMVLNVFLDYKKSVINGKFVIIIKNRMMRQLQKLSLIRIQELKVGGIISRLQQDAETMSDILFEGIVSPINAIIMLLISLFSLFLINWEVTMIFILFSLLIGALGYFIFNIMMPFHKTLREDNSNISTYLTEIFNGIMIAKSFCKEQSIRRGYGHHLNLFYRKILYGQTIDIFSNRVIWLLFYLAQISVWLFGGYNVVHTKMTVGEIVVFISFVSFIFNPILNIMSSFSQLQQSLACADRVFDLLDEKMEIDNSSKDLSVFNNEMKEELAFQNVNFSYPDGTLALKNVSIKIPNKKVTALVGPSGGGKTTIINLILRFYEVSQGKITIDGINIKKVNLQNYRKMLGLVLQEIFLFCGSIKENISYANPLATQDEIEKVAKVANCHGFIQKLKYGYETEIGEKGVRLSYGQKQRIVLARALLTNPQILILDEATSNLDPESEDQIQDSLRDIFRKKTTVVIAHRLSTIMDADNIVVIEDGKVIEQGNFDELMSKKGKFTDMYNRQRKERKREKNYWDV